MKDLYFEAAAVIITLILLGKYLEAVAKGRQEFGVPAGLRDLRTRQKEFDLVPDPETFEAIPGRGVKAVVNSATVLIGTRKLMQETGIETAHINHSLEALEDNGKTAMIMSVNEKIEAVIAVADTLKENSTEALTSFCRICFGRSSTM